MKLPTESDIPERRMVPGFSNLCWMDVKIISVLAASMVIVAAPLVWYALMFRWF